MSSPKDRLDGREVDVLRPSSRSSNRSFLQRLKPSPLRTPEDQRRSSEPFLHRRPHAPVRPPMQERSEPATTRSASFLQPEPFEELFDGLELQKARRGSKASVRDLSFLQRHAEALHLTLGHVATQHAQLGVQTAVALVLGRMISKSGKSEFHPLTANGFYPTVKEFLRDLGRGRKLSTGLYVFVVCLSILHCPEKGVVLFLCGSGMRGRTRGGRPDAPGERTTRRTRKEKEFGG